jgi:hypothetical protein
MRKVAANKQEDRNETRKEAVRLRTIKNISTRQPMEDMKDTSRRGMNPFPVTAATSEET